MVVRATLMVDSDEAKATANISDKALNLAFPDGKKRELRRPLPGFDSIEAALQEFAAGKFVVVLDNEDRENEGDLIMAADKARPAPLPCISAPCLNVLRPGFNRNSVVQPGKWRRQPEIS